MSGLGGLVLAAFFRLLQLVRSPRPVHTRGALFAATVRWTRPARSGIGWVDVPPPGGTQAGLVRVSRSVGLPAPLPDVFGLALRMGTAEGRADVELAGTGIGVPWRFLLRPSRSPSTTWLSTLLPYRGTRGPVLLAARTRTPHTLPSRIRDLAREPRPWVLDLYWAEPAGKWHRFGELELTALPGDGDLPSLRFDAGRNMIPGARFDDWVMRLRQPGYVLIQGDAPSAAAAPGPEDPRHDTREDRLRDGGAEDVLER